MKSIFLTAFGIALLIPRPAPAQISSATFVGSALDSNVDRRGMDYANFELDQADPNLCRNACLREQPRCKAFTYVKPGVQGSRSRCYLSSHTSVQVRNDCCISGIVSTPQYSTQELTNEPSRSELFELIVRAREAGHTPPAGAVFVLNAPFKFPDDVLYDVGHRPRSPSLFGIDISHYTLSTIPLDRLASMEVRFVYLKASQGIRGKDPKFDSFWQRLGNLPNGSRVHRGAYHFLSADDDGTLQARFYVSVLNQNGGITSTDMPPVVDLEWDKVGNEPDRWEAHSSKQILAELLAWLNTVEHETKRVPMIYTNSVWWAERMRTEDFTSLAQYKVWVADYSMGDLEIEKPTVPPGAPWALWQFTDGAHFATGFDPAIDATIFKGKEDAFYTAFDLHRF
jgi:lysozyme